MRVYAELVLPLWAHFWPVLGPCALPPALVFVAAIRRPTQAEMLSFVPGKVAP